MSAIKPKTLGSVISVSKGKKHIVAETPSSSSKRLLGIDDLRNDNLLRYTDESLGTAVLPEDVLIAWDGANAGTIGFGKSGYIGSTIARLRIDKEERLFTPFLGAFLKSKFDYLRQTATGATIPHISRKALDSIALPDVDFDDQVRIAHLLGKVEGLIAQRKQHLQQFDDLFKSVFLNMFGEPTKNEKNWDQEYLGKLTSEKIGYGIVQPGSPVDDGVPTIRVGDFIGTRIRTDGIEKVSKEISKKHKNSILKGDEILLACVGATIGKVAAVEPIHAGYNIVRATARIRVSQRVNKLFLLHFLLSDFAKNYYLKVTRSVGQPTLNIKQIEELPVITPPIELQKRFSVFVEKSEILKTHYQQSLADLEDLYGALSQKAFKGELDLSRVSLPADITQPIPAYAAMPNAEVTTPTALVHQLVQSAEPQGRYELLARWFRQYLANTPPATGLRAAEMMEDAWQALQTAQLEVKVSGEEEEEEEEAPPDLADYDVLKALIFKALETGELLQTFDDDRNQVVLKSQSAEWGTW